MSNHQHLKQHWAEIDGRSFLQSVLDEVFAQHGIDRQELCTKQFFALAEAYWIATTREETVTPKEELLLTDVRKHATTFANALRKLEPETVELLPGFVSTELEHMPFVCEALASAISSMLGGTENDRKAKEMTAWRFVKLCLDFGIPITYSKDITDSKNRSVPGSLSARLLGAVFAAGGMETEGDKKTPVHKANYYINKLSKGFVCETQGLLVRIFFDRICIEPDPYLQAMIQEVLEGSNEMPSTNLVPRASCTDQDIDLKGKIISRTTSDMEKRSK